MTRALGHAFGLGLGARVKKDVSAINLRPTITCPAPVCLPIAGLDVVSAAREEMESLQMILGYETADGLFRRSWRKAHEARRAL